ncbi:hypothetical protein FKM82_024955 [Ascaphus truei]
MATVSENLVNGNPCYLSMPDYPQKFQPDFQPDYLYQHAYVYQHDYQLQQLSTTGVAGQLSPVNYNADIRSDCGSSPPIWQSL